MNQFWVPHKSSGDDMLYVLWNFRQDSLCHSGVTPADLIKIQVYTEYQPQYEPQTFLKWMLLDTKPISQYSFWQSMSYRINHNTLAPSPYMLIYKWGSTWQHIHMDDRSEGVDNINRPRLPPSWQYVNFPKSLNREGIIYPSVVSEHSFVLIRCDVEKQSETCHSVVKVIDNGACFVWCHTELCSLYFRCKVQRI